MLSLDHIVVVAETLKEGREFVEDTLGVRMQSGGTHALMGTHNMLLGMEDGLYLEVISIDPDAVQPKRNRWFGLDAFKGSPRLTNWVSQSDELSGDMQAVFGGNGSPVLLSRGDLTWEMSLIDEGQTPFDGLVPMMLNWGDGPKASDRLLASGCRVSRLVLGHPDHSDLTAMLAGLVEDERVEIEISAAPKIIAVVQTPRGEVILK